MLVLNYLKTEFTDNWLCDSIQIKKIYFSFSFETLVNMKYIENTNWAQIGVKSKSQPSLHVKPNPRVIPTLALKTGNGAFENLTRDLICRELGRYRKERERQMASWLANKRLERCAVRPLAIAAAPINQMLPHFSQTVIN